MYITNCFRKTNPNKDKSYLVRVVLAFWGLALFSFQALEEDPAEYGWQIALALQIAHLVYGSVVLTVDHIVSIAVLSVLIHIVLYGVCRTVWIIDAVREG